MNLFEKFKEVESSDILKEFKSIYKDSNGDSTKAMEGIFLTMVAGLIRRSNSVMSTNMMISQISKNYTVEIQKFNFGAERFRKEEVEELIQFGLSHISQIFPAFKSPLLSLISFYAGSGKAETSGFIGYITTYIIQKLGEMINEGTSTEELIDYLQMHRQELFERAPLELMEKMIPALGLQELKDIKYTPRKIKKSRKEEVEEVMEEETVDYEASKNPTKSILIGLFAVLLIAFLGFMYWKRDTLFPQDQNLESQLIREDELLDSLEVMSEKPQVVADWSKIKEVLEAETLNTNAIVKLEEIAFANGSEEIENLQTAVADSILATFISNPKFQIQIIGSDSTGDSQKAIRRAFFLKRWFQNKGISSNRIDAVADKHLDNSLKIRVVTK